MELTFRDKAASALVRLFSRPARPLPENNVKRYVQNILFKKELYLESAKALGTPQYFYDETSIESSVDRFYSTFKSRLENFHMFYAMKSNHLPEIARKVSDMGHGLDVSSGTELKNALAAGCRRIIFSGPGKRDEELELAAANSSIITIMLDSPGEYQRLAALLKRKKNGETDRICAGIRIRNPRQGYWNKFGIKLEDSGSFLKTVTEDGLIKASGLQFHTSWNLGPELQVKLIEDIAQHLKNKIPQDYLSDFRFFDIGGGYWPDNGEWLHPENTTAGRVIKTLMPGTKFENRHYYMKSTGLDYFALKISEALKNQGQFFKDLNIYAEPGRWISTKSMHILVKVIDIKERVNAVTDGGINILGWERPLTEYIPVINLSDPSMTENEFTVYGPLCTPDDVWGKNLFGSSIKNNDIIIIPDQGAYTYSLRQAFIKPVPRIIRYDGINLKILKGESEFLSY